MKFLHEIKQPESHWKYYLAGIGAWLVCATSNAGEVASAPLFLSTTVKPNILLMLDDSLSMNDTMTIAGASTVYNPLLTYPRNASCSSTVMPGSNDTGTTSSICTNAGGSWTGSPRRCVITYGTSVPRGFYGKVNSGTAGTYCFSAGKTYATSSGLTVPPIITTAAQKANWLNWYYSNELAKVPVTKSRMQVAKDAATVLLNTLNNDVRLGFSTFNGENGGELLEVVDDLGTTKKSNILNRINNSSPSSYTPLAETLSSIGRYFANGPEDKVNLRAGIKDKEKEEDKSSVFSAQIANGTPWTGRTAISGEPTFANSRPIQYSCQKSFTVFLTDGLPTRDRTISDLLKDYDGDCQGDNSSKCTGVADMKRAYPYPGGNGLSSSDRDYKAYGAGDTSSDYFDDVSQALYEMDLRPDLRNDKESKGAKNNLTTFVVGFADDAINPDIEGVNPIAKDAALQGGGKFFYAGNEGELASSLVRAFQFISERNSASSSVAANSTQYQTNALLFQALFDSSDWSGDIRTYNLDTEDTNHNGKLDKPTDSPQVVTVSEDTNNNGVLDVGMIGSVRWLASNNLPTHDLRNIYSYDAAAKKGIKFFWNVLNNAQKTVLDSAKVANNGKDDSLILNYIRGDQTNEGSGATEFRVRSSLLGDIVNSDPLFVGGQNLGYASLPGVEGSSYQSYVTAKSANQEMLYVGANDGMLHAFQVDVNSSHGQEGEEVFAYIPNAVISPELASLSERSYTHRYFVDGAPQYGDAYLGGQWHSILIGSMGAGNTTAVGTSTGTGGRGIFALDITVPDNFSENEILWEFTNRDDADLGYTFSQANVIRTYSTGHNWVVAVGNGYNSPSGKSVLFFIDVKTGQVIKKIEAESTTGGNGLSTPTPMDVDGDKIIDYIYAGDLKGNVWKFDITNTDETKWDVAYSKAPFYTANDQATTPARQPITSQLSAAKAKGKDQNTGVMVYFGTGKYYENGDHQVSSSPQIQTFYGLWDKCDKTNSSTCNGAISDGRTSLVQQTIASETHLSALDQDVRLTTSCEVVYGTSAPNTTVSGCSNLANRKGWYINLVAPNSSGQGERMVSTPAVRDTTVIFTTLIPINATCEPDGTGWLMELDTSGSRFSGSPIDINGDGKINDADMFDAGDGNKLAVSGLKSKVGIIETPTIVGNGTSAENKYLNGSSSVVMRVVECPPGGCVAPTPVCDATDPSSSCYSGGGLGSRRSWRQLR